MAEEPVEPDGLRRRCKDRNGSMGLLGYASPRNGRRSRRWLELETREERDLGMVEKIDEVEVEEDERETGDGGGVDVNDRDNNDKEDEDEGPDEFEKDGFIVDDIDEEELDEEESERADSEWFWS
ncbi:unnamed protein product [Camellia sinensis]